MTAYEAIWILVAMIAWALVLTFSYRRSDPASRNRGLLAAISWLALIIPMAYYRLDGDVRLVAGSSIGGALLLLLFTRGRLEAALLGRGRKDNGSHEEADDVAPGHGIVIWLIVAAIFVGLFVSTYL